MLAYAPRDDAGEDMKERTAPLPRVILADRPLRTHDRTNGPHPSTTGHRPDESAGPPAPRYGDLINDGS